MENYELGFHLVPELEEADLKNKTQELETNIARLGGVVLLNKEPRKQRLSYPINHKRQAFFGTINFKSPTLTIDDLKNSLKLNESLLRYLIIKVRENPKVLRIAKESTVRAKVKTHIPPAPEAKPKEEIKPEVMEKQLEEAIENL